MSNQKSHQADSMSPNITLREMYTQWADKKYKGISRGTIHCYTAGWGRLSKYANLRVKDIRTEHFQEIIDSIIKSGMSRSTLEKQRTVSVLLCNYALENGVVDTNYAKFIRLPKIERPKKVIDPRVLEKNMLKEKKEKERSVIFRERMKVLLKERQISRKDLSVKLGLAPREMDRYLDGYVRPSLSLLAKIGDFFGVSIDYLVGKEVDDDELKIHMIQRAYTMLPAKDKKYIIGMVKIMLEKIEEEGS